MADFALYRKNMVESQVRTNDVTDRRLLRAMLDTPRERFVPAAMQALAYNGEGVGLTLGLTARALPPPMTTAKMLQLAAIEATESVLEIGCATGYTTAIIACLAAKVTGLDSDAGLCASATANLTALGLTNATIVTGPLADGFTGGAPYDVIFVTGAVPEIPAQWRDQLKPTGRVVAVIADGPVTRAMVFERTAAGAGSGFAHRFGFDTPALLLPGFERKLQFAL